MYSASSVYYGFVLNMSKRVSSYTCRRHGLNDSTVVAIVRVRVGVYV